MRIKFITIIILIWLSSNIFSQSDTSSVILTSKIPPIITPNVTNILTILNNTVWVTTDLANNRDIYVRFQDNKYESIAFPRGNIPNQVPTQSFPLTFHKQGKSPNESIFIVASDKKILYYSFRLVTPYYLLISAGFNSDKSLLNISMEDYFKNGNILQLVF